MDLEPSTERRTSLTYAASVFDAPPPDAAGDVSLMDVEEVAPEPAFTPLAVGAPSAAVPGLRSRKEGTTARAPSPPTAPRAPPSPRASSPRAPSPRPPSPDAEEETSVVLRPAPRAPRRSARTFSERARDYLYARTSRSDAPSSEPRAGLLDRPEVFLTYAQVIFNASLLLVFLYLLFCVVYTVQRDVSQKVREYEIGTWRASRRIPRRNRRVLVGIRDEPVRHRPAGARARRGVCDVAAVCVARPHGGGPRTRHRRDVCRDPERVRRRGQLEDDGTPPAPSRSSFRSSRCPSWSARRTRRCPSSAAPRTRAARPRPTTRRPTMRRMRSVSYTHLTLPTNREV